MKGNSPKNKTPSVSALTKRLELLEEKAADACLEKQITKEFVYFINNAQVLLKKGQMDEADNRLSSALLLIKRNMAAEINLRLASELASQIIEEVKRYIADPAHLFVEAVDFSEKYLVLLSETGVETRPPEYLKKRPFPKAYGNAAKQVRAKLKSFELPKPIFKQLISDIDALEETAGKVKNGRPTTAQSRRSTELIASIYISLFGIQGIYITERQLNAVMGIIFFAWPAWLCWNILSWIVQAIAIIAFLIIKAVASDAAAQKATTYIWTYIEDCQANIAQAKNKVRIELNGLSKDQMKQVLEGLKALRKNFNKLSYTGKKGAVRRKLNAVIAEVTRIIAATP